MRKSGCSADRLCLRPLSTLTSSTTHQSCLQDLVLSRDQVGSIDHLPPFLFLYLPNIYKNLGLEIFLIDVWWKTNTYLNLNEYKQMLSLPLQHLEVVPEELTNPAMTQRLVVAWNNIMLRLKVL